MVLLSTHSNPKILKSNRRSRYGQALSTYDSEEDEEEDDDFEEDENEYGFENVSEEDWLTDVSPSTLFWFWTVELSWECVLVALEEKIVILNNFIAFHIVKR